MAKRSSPHEGTTESTYIDLGATTKEALAISLKSRNIARSAIGDHNPEDRVRQRCAIAVGDIAMANLMRFLHDPVFAGLEALKSRSCIITDIRMVQVGIQKQGHESHIICALDHGSDISAREGITRSSAGFIELGPRIDESIIVIGNAPSALITLCDLIHEGRSPALVIGTPVGFVNAAESKALLRTYAVPSISTDGTRGGTPVAVAAMNEIITIFAKRHE
ncbi:MAG: precorrin-8X methylmutase [Methanomicrobiales archaeon]|jgi:precorrin-8X/cobalt-precorrin-8 methylmutase|nr:precorrin-8X methylmutase [Methanomicrobiales archaeon]